MIYFERAVSRTTRIGSVAGLSIVLGLILGLVFFISSGEPGALGLEVAGPIAALLIGSPLRWLFAQAAKVPLSTIFVEPVLLAYWLRVKPDEIFALRKEWVVILDD